jgi:hypothetical protein
MKARTILASSVMAIAGLFVGPGLTNTFAASGGGCGPFVSANGVSFEACISFDALANFGFGAYVGDGHLNGKPPANCQLHSWFITADASSHGREAEQTTDCSIVGAGNQVAVDQSNYGINWEEYTVCLVVSGRQKACATSRKQFR